MVIKCKGDCGRVLRITIHHLKTHGEVIYLCEHCYQALFAHLVRVFVPVPTEQAEGKVS